MTYKLSICIPTLNRAQFIGETLDSIVVQLTEEVEVVIVDGGSVDETEAVVRRYQTRFPQVRYVRKTSDGATPSNSGFDRDCHHAVELARARYCWLMTDDDLLAEGAIQRILRELDAGYALIVASVEIRDKSLRRVLAARRPDLAEDRRFGSATWDEFVAVAGKHLTFVGAVVVDRNFWLGRIRERYFGTGFVHVGVIFDRPIEGSILLVSQPLVIIRMGNAQWSSRAFQIWMFGWPELIWSFSGIPDDVKKRITARHPWDNLKVLLAQRTFGTYSLREYRLFLRHCFTSKPRRLAAWSISVVPRLLLLPLAWLYAMTRPAERTMMLFELRQSWRRK